MGQKTEGQKTEGKKTGGKKPGAVKNLGLILDTTLEMEKQVNSVCKSCYYRIRNGLIRKYINAETSKTLVQAFFNFSTELRQCIDI